MAARSGGTRSRSATTGQYVTQRTAARSPRTTVTESTTGKGSTSTSSRSAITGRYVMPQTAARHPSTTVTEGKRK